MRYLPLLAIAAGLGPALVGCQAEEQTDAVCTVDEDCPGGLVCDTRFEGGLCKCQSNDGCNQAYPGKSMFCNSSGDCQERPDCLDNVDCADKPGTYCNTLSGTCISNTTCGYSVHCPLNQICDRATGACKIGCTTTGDCILGYVCTGPITGKTCQPGNCTWCDSNAQCEWGKVCNQLTNQCMALPGLGSTSLCDSCSQTNPCPQGYTCLLDDAQAGAQYCVRNNCHSDLDCPSGYGQCGTGLSFVTDDWSCQDDGYCSGIGMGPCAGSAEGQIAYCACTATDQCQIQGISFTGGTCGPGGFCTHPSFNYSEFACTSDADCEVTCKPNPADVNEANGWPASTGACTINQGVCAKGDGVTCATLQNPGTSPCHIY